MKIIFCLIAAAFLSSRLHADPIRVVGHVLNKMPDGLLVMCKADPRAIGVTRANGAIFLKGHPKHAEMVDKASINCLATVTGIYEYTTVLKSKATVQELTFEK